MKFHRYKALGDSEVRKDGLAVVLDVQTHTATPFKVEIPITEVSNIISHLGVLSRSAGASRGLPEHYETNEHIDAAQMSANAMAVMLGTQGKLNVVFRVGALDLALEVDPQIFQGAVAQLVALTQSLAAEPKMAH
jgi:hypothetical protein